MTTTTGVRLSAIPPASPLELDGLELLPCGCVIAIQHAEGWPVRAISLEAKGSYCPVAWHRPDRVLTLGDPSDEFDGITDDLDLTGQPAAMAR